MVFTEEVDRLSLQKQEGVVCSAAARVIPRGILVLLSSGSLYNDYSHVCVCSLSTLSDVL